MVEPEKRRDGLGIADGALEHHFYCRWQGDHALVDDLVVFGFGLALAQAGRQIDSHGFGDKAGAGIELENPAPMIGAVTGFLDQFAFGSRQFGFAGIDAAGRQFPEIIASRVAILALEQYAGRSGGIIDGQNDDGAGVVNEIAADFDTSRLLNMVGSDPEDGAAIDRTGRNQARLGVIFAFQAARRTGRRHGNNIKQTSVRSAGFRWSAMLPGMQGKPRVAIVGPGHLGSALAIALGRVGYAIDAVVGRPQSLRRARALAKKTSARASRDLSQVRADVVWFCVPDSEIAHAAKTAANTWQAKGYVALHSSGALTSDELSSLRRRGAAVASLHPLMTFVGGSRPSFDGVPFAIEGDAAALRVAREIIKSLGGRAYAIRKKDKAAYHAWGTFASPLLTALLATTERVAESAGVDRTDAARRMMPILRQTLENYGQFGAAKGFSGPIIRGDVETIRRHLRVLKNVPVAREVYKALAGAALQYLPAKNRAKLRRVLDS